MRILASIILVGAIYAFPLSQVAKADANQDVVQNSEQKSNIENSSESQNNYTIKSYNVNFIAPIYMPEVNAIKLATFEKSRQARMPRLTKGGFVINASAYTAAADECGKSDGVTASGMKVAEGRTLACPKQYKFGTKIQIDGMGTYVCEDRGGAIKSNHFDIYMQTKKQAFAFGRRNLIARVVE